MTNQQSKVVAKQERLDRIISALEKLHPGEAVSLYNLSKAAGVKVQNSDITILTAYEPRLFESDNGKVGLSGYIRKPAVYRMPTPGRQRKRGE